VHILVICI